MILAHRLDDRGAAAAYIALRFTPSITMKKLALTLVAATLAIAAHAQTPAAPAAAGTPAPGAAAAKPKPLGASDKKFIMDLSNAILTEQKYLQLIVDNKTATFDPATTRATGTMSGDLKKIWTALATIATTKGAEVAQEVSKSDLAKVQKLGKEKPDKFEKEFFKDLAKETKQTAKLFEASKTLQDPDVKKFADDWNVTIKSHDASVEAAEKQLAGKKK
jgi:hypothetical protein